MSKETYIINQFLLFFIIQSIVFVISCNNKTAENKLIDSTILSARSLKDSTLPYPKDTILPNKELIQIDSVEASKLEINLKPKKIYNLTKNSIKTDREKFRKRYNETPDSLKENIIFEAGDYIYETLLNKIIPHWYGMTWDFSGYSAIPQTGTVGCSYFVSNTLLHSGFNLNRYRLAQADATTIARSIQTSNKIIILKNKTKEELIKYAHKNLNEGLYVIGLDCHVGYLLYRKNKIFFIHSSYIFPVEVVIEKAELSEALNSQIYVIGKLTTNKDIIIKWLENKKIEILKK